MSKTYAEISDEIIAADDHPSVSLYVENLVFGYDEAVCFQNSVEIEQNNVNVYLTRERAMKALAFLADTLGATVYHEGKQLSIVS